MAVAAGVIASTLSPIQIPEICYPDPGIISNRAARIAKTESSLVSRVCARLRYAKGADFARRHDALLESPVLGVIRFSMGFYTL